MSLKAIILVGGPSRGTRFRPLSLDVPKPLFPIAGHPVIYHHLKSLSSVGDVKDVFLIGFFEDSVFAPYLSLWRQEFPSLNVKYLREYQSLGTAGGLFHFRDELRRNSPKGLFVIHADICSNIKYDELIEFHNTKGGLCTIVGTKVARDQAKNYGCLVADPDTLEVKHYVEKPETFVSDLISCGVYLFSTDVFDAIKKAKDQLSSSTEDEPSHYLTERNQDQLRLEQDLLQPLAGQHQLFVFQNKQPWRQLSTASSALLANALLLKELSKTDPNSVAKNQRPDGYEVVGSVYVHPTATIDPTAKLGPNVSIGPNVVLEAGVRIREAIILDNVKVKANACVVHSIIGWDSSIGKWSRIEGTEGDSSNLYGATLTQNGVKVQSTTILGKEVSVRDEVVIRNCLVLPHKELKENFHNEILM